MLNSSSPPSLHKLQNFSLILLSALLLPFDTLTLAVCYLYNLTIQSDVQQRRSRSQERTNFIPRTILVTGVGMTKGLVLARYFYAAGHHVIGADFESNGALVCGRFSRSVSKFFPLIKPSPATGSSRYIQGLLSIILKEKVDLWVSCSGVASAVEDGEAKEIVEARTPCKAIQFDVQTTQMLHEKHTFIQHASELALTVPETHVITSSDSVKKILQNSPSGRRCIMKTIGVVDAVRADMTLLPKPTPEETAAHIARLLISKETPWILQQYIQGSEYCTHSLVVRGEVKAFVACPSSELLMHYEALPAASPLSESMLAFTQTFAKDGGEGFTGHLSFDFLVENDAATTSKDVVLYPIECNPRAHTAVVLFNPGSRELVDAYLALLRNESNSLSPSTVVTPTREYKYYWLPHDLIANLILPTLHLLLWRTTLTDFRRSSREFLTHLLLWRDGTFEVWDPLPWWWLYHGYWPVRFLGYIRSAEKWSRVNVSTGKVFEC